VAELIGPAEIMERLHDGSMTPEDAGNAFRLWMAARPNRTPEFDQQENRLLCGHPFVICEVKSDG
jgi:hypothetical protein